MIRMQCSWSGCVLARSWPDRMTARLALTGQTRITSRRIAGHGRLTHARTQHWRSDCMSAYIHPCVCACVPVSSRLLAAAAAGVRLCCRSEQAGAVGERESGSARTTARRRGASDQRGCASGVRHRERWGGEKRRACAGGSEPAAKRNGDRRRSRPRWTQRTRHRQAVRVVHVSKLDYLMMIDVILNVVAAFLSQQGDLNFLHDWTF
jgi:hypothetical protein